MNMVSAKGQNSLFCAIVLGVKMALYEMNVKECMLLPTKSNNSLLEIAVMFAC